MPLSKTESTSNRAKQDDAIGVIGVMGVACRLPGAPSYSGLKELLMTGTCAISEVPGDRFAKARYLHPKQGTRGKSYTFAAGVLDNIWEFDPLPFGISPREATQMDPQQRILLQVVWEAIEDAGIPHTNLAGHRVGVFVGASSTDYRDSNTFDPGSTDPYMMTGNTMSLISNRISYIFDFKGPSYTVDTACSSSLVAMEGAVRALKAGEIDTAVVGGVNALLSPFPFVGFSAAGMLSPAGLCRAFDAKGAGYVRAEGAVAVLLQRTDLAPDEIKMHRKRAEIIDAGINSDGKTVGVSLPSEKTQGALLNSLYERAQINPDDIAFFEAHGTGTRVGDPVEAQAIGEAVAQRRSEPLLIGSIKSNIGHLEPAAGLAGLLKSLIAFEENTLPASLHFETPNPDIPFDEFNLKVAAKSTPLKSSQNPRYAGVSTFGFGGTNAHVIIREVPKARNRRSKNKNTNQPGLLTLSAHGEVALRELAARYCTLIDEQPSLTIADIAGAVQTQRAHLADCLSVRAENTSALRDVLHAFAHAEGVNVFTEGATLTIGRAVRQDDHVAFVFTGNGAQFVGMGRDEYAHNPAFKAHFDRISKAAETVFGWSASELLVSSSLDGQIDSTAIAQPLLFVLQMAITACLEDFGIKPQASFGHSVGEVAAATASGALSLDQGIAVIHARSQQQETTRGRGKMAAGGIPLAEAETLLSDLRQNGHTIVVAAINGPQAVTVSGDIQAVEAFALAVKRLGKPAKVLDLDYGFHSALMDPIESGIKKQLKKLTASKSDHAFISTVEGKVLDGSKLDADYWWRNIREPVRFQDAAEEAFNMGCRIFIEIGPRSIFKTNLRDTFADRSEPVTHVETLKQAVQKAALADTPTLEYGRHIELSALTAVASGARYITVDKTKPKHSSITLPTYPWQNKSFRMAASAETVNGWQSRGTYHMLLGHAEHGDAIYWRSQIDGNVLPLLSDHKVDGKVIVPGAAYVEIILAAAAQYFVDDRIEIRDMDIVRAIEIPDDQMIDLHTEISEDASSVSISSRRRLSEDEWALNASARIAKIPGMIPEENEIVAPESGDVLLEAEDLYNLARNHGLDYGPAFARATKISVTSDDNIQVDFADPDETVETRAGATTFLLNPTDLDIAFHGLVALYKSDKQREIEKAFIPVRFGKLQIFQTGKRTHFARVSIGRFTPRNIAADFSLYDRDGHLIARLEDARFKAASLAQRQKLDDFAYHFGTRLLPHPIEPTDPVSGVAKESLPELLSIPNECFLNGDWAESEARLLLTAAAQKIASDAVAKVSHDGQIKVQHLLERGIMQPEELPRLMCFLSILENMGFATDKGESEEWTISDEIDLPQVDAILRTVLEAYPAWAAECVMLSHIAHHTANEGLRGLEAPSAFETSTMDQFRTSSPEADDHVELIVGMITKLTNHWPAGRPFRILEIGNRSGGLTRRLVPLLNDGQGSLVSCGSDRRSKGMLSLSLMDHAHVEIVDVDELTAMMNECIPFDLVVSANGLSNDRDCETLLRLSARVLREDGQLLISETSPSTLHDVAFAYEEGWFERTVNPEFPLSAQRMGEEWQRLLAGVGFAEIKVSEADDDGLPALLIQGYKASLRIDTTNVINIHNKPDEIIEESESYPFFVLASEETRGLSDQLTSRLAGHMKDDVRVLVVDKLSPKIPTEAIESYLLSADTSAEKFNVVDFSISHAETDQELLSARIQRLNLLVQSFDLAIETLWVIAPGGARGLTGHGTSNPLETGIWTYARTVRNEYPDISVRSVDFAESLSPEQSISLLGDHIQHNFDWSEAVLSDEACVELVTETGRPELETEVGVVPHEMMASTLVFEDLSGVDELKWSLQDRRAPQVDEVEIEVSATGLNFRDVMWTLGVLPDEALEDGFAGATLGFECSGRVVRVGEGVTEFKVGDPVIALGPACFSSHVTFNTVSVVRLPDEIDLTAAATIPVTFLTAYYALHDLARLEQDEWVLIQGGAGGVGLAAIQIAQECGAQIIATAGTEEKRNLLRTLGVNHVLDSRSLDFVNQVMDITGDGVDCVLNSLFGEAMERGIELLKPFGRFLELGKRDYYGNTKIGLRPFRRNITYFGIDADQLLSQKPRLARRLFKELIEHFETDTFFALPYRHFEGREIIDAFRLMQKSGHIGKIVVTPTPPGNLELPVPEEQVNFADDGHFIIIGGLGGFGLEVAKWAINKGARHITLTSRTGTMTSQQESVVALLREQGATVEAVACDVSDKIALEVLLNDLRKTAPIKGIIHAAMVLRDGLISNMSEADINDVLTPKVRGAHNIDELTVDDPLDVFILFSSITTFFGNPGQASYVAANGYLEGLARKRRENGKPAMAVGWGAITDVGYLARNEEIGGAIAKRTGTMNFTAKQALGALDRLLASDDGSVHRAVISVGPMNWSIAKSGLSIISTPSFKTLSRQADQASQGVSEALDVASLIAGKTEPEARAILSGMLAREVSVVLRTPVEEINVKRPLTDLGMDSLMGVELRMTAQQKLGVDIPLASIANGVSVDDIARKIVERMRVSDENSSEDFSELVSYHVVDENYSESIRSFEAEISNKDK